MAKERLQRQLAAILSADVVGYSRLMGINEARDTRQRLKAYAARTYRSEDRQPIRGRIVKLMGDGMLVEFGSAVDAVTCAIEIQREMSRCNIAKKPQDKRIELRIGINVGDIIIEGDDILAMASTSPRNWKGSPNREVSAFRGRARQVTGEGRRSFLRTGACRPQEHRKSRCVSSGPGLIAPPQATFVRQSGASCAPDKPSIAVLPFQNMSGDAEQEHFCDGLVEDIITTLSKLAGLRVIARNSTFVYKGRSVDVREAAKQLGVRYVLEGSVRKSGNRIRITAQLIDAKDGAHLWAERYDRAMDDIFAIQDEITLVLATEMQVKLTEGEQARLHYTTTTNVEAWTYWVQGMSHHRQAVTKEDRARLGFFGKKHLRLTRTRHRSMPCSASCMAWMPASDGGTTVRPRSTRLGPTPTGRLKSIPGMPTPTPLQA